MMSALRAVVAPAGSCSIVAGRQVADCIPGEEAGKIECSAGRFGSVVGQWSCFGSLAFGKVRDLKSAARTRTAMPLLNCNACGPGDLGPPCSPLFGTGSHYTSI
mgnify:FL=1